MTHAEYLSAVPLEKDIAVLNDIRSTYLLAETPAAPLDLKDTSAICANILEKLTLSSGDARITNALSVACGNFYTALRTAVSGLITTITADREAI